MYLKYTKERQQEKISEERPSETVEEEGETTTLRALAADISEGLEHVKRSGSNDKRAAYSAFKSLAFGKHVSQSKAKKSLSKLVNVDSRVVSKAVQERSKVLAGERKSWLYTERKSSDAVSEDLKQHVFNFWTNEASRPTGDRKDTIKQRASNFLCLSLTSG